MPAVSVVMNHFIRRSLSTGSFIIKEFWSINGLGGKNECARKHVSSKAAVVTKEQIKLCTGHSGSLLYSWMLNTLFLHNTDKFI